MAALLIVDDYQLIREVLVELFAPDHACEAVESAEQALTLLESKYFDVAIVDISLPGMSGLELFGHIRQRWPETQVIIITGIDYHQYVENLIGLGASDYLVKPFQLQDVQSSVARANLKQEGWLEAVKESTRRALGQSAAIEVSGGMIERRRAVRLNTQRAARLIFTTAPADLSVADSAQPTPTVIGHTRDISLTGLSLVVPGIHESDGKFYGVRSQVRINLSLPQATIDIEVKPVRYQWLGEQEGKKSYLVGAHIVRMSDEDRAKFNDYLGQASGPTANSA
jgi:CheY-like chemotaxis protein